MNNFITRAGKAFGIAGGVGTISDVLQPIAPVASYVMGASAIVFILLAVTKFISKTWNETLVVSMYLSCGLFLFSSILFFYQQTDKQSKEQGILAANIPLASDFQKNLGLVQKGIETIATHTISIDEKMDNVKKEISNDPKKELANQGIKWKNKDFKEAVINCDIPTIKLFIEGHYGINLYAGANNNFFLSLIHDTPSDKFKQVIKLLVDHNYIKINHKILIYTMNSFSEGFVQLPYPKLGARFSKYFVTVRMAALTKGKGGAGSSYTTTVNLLTIAVWEGDKRKIKALIELGEDPHFQGRMDAADNKSPIISPITEAKLFARNKVSKLFER